MHVQNLNGYERPKCIFETSFVRYRFLRDVFCTLGIFFLSSPCVSLWMSTCVVIILLIKKITRSQWTPFRYHQRSWSSILTNRMFIIIPSHSLHLFCWIYFCGDSRIWDLIVKVNLMIILCQLGIWTSFSRYENVMKRHENALYNTFLY